MTYRDSNDPTNRSVDRPGPKLAWILGLVLAMVLGFGIYSAFKSGDAPETYPDAMPAAGRDDPVDAMSPTAPDDPNWPGPVQPQNPPSAPDRGG